VRNAGVQVLPGEAGGLDPADRLLVFAVNTYNRWSSPSLVEYDIAIDTKGNSDPEFFVVGVDLGAVTAGEFDSRMGSFVFDAAGTLIDAFFADAPMNGSTLLLPAAASMLGLTKKSDSFHYSLTSFSVLTGVADPVPGRPRFRAFDPSISQGDFVVLAPGARARLALTADTRAARNDHTLGWLVVGLDDANGPAQSDQVSLR